jgi:acyl-CoA thioesterase
VQVRQPISPSKNLRPFDLSDGTKDMDKICFSCILSFKKDEPFNSAHTELKDWNAEYGSAVKDINPTTFPQTPDVDTPWYDEYQREFEPGVTFPGLDIRKVDMREFNKGKPTLQYRQLHYYRLIGNIPDDQPNLHAAAHCYASDRNSLFLITNALGFGNQLAKIASLTHSVVFHTDSRGLLLKGQQETDKDNWVGWWVQEAWTPRSEGGRGLHESKIWRLDGGESVHVATTMQDGLVRKAADESESMRGNKKARMEENWKKSFL